MPNTTDPKLERDTQINELAATVGDRVAATMDQAMRTGAGRVVRDVDDVRRLVVDATYAVLCERDYLAMLDAGGDIKPGDVVRLRSGGPPMTVGSIEKPTALMVRAGVSHDAVSCFWIGEGGPAQSAMFPARALERAGGLPDLYKAALALWGAEPKLDRSARAPKHAIDYLQSPESARLVRQLGEALTAIDGIARSFDYEVTD